MKLTDEEAAECSALKALFKAHAGMSQAQFALRHDLGNQSNVSHYLNKHQPLTLEAATKFAKGLGVAIDDFSPRLARQARSLANIALSDELDDLLVASSERQPITLPANAGRDLKTPMQAQGSRYVKAVTTRSKAPIVAWGILGADLVNSAVKAAGELSAPVDFSNDTVVWAIEDDAMVPDYNPGDLIAVDCSADALTDLIPGDAVIVETPAGSQLLRYYTPLADGHFEARPTPGSRFGVLSTLQMALHVRAVVAAHLKVRRRPRLAGA